MARKYFLSMLLVGPETTTTIPEDVEEYDKEELVKEIRLQKAMIKKVYSRFMEKIKELRLTTFQQCRDNRI